MRFVLGDITKVTADAIVNSASCDLRPHPGVCQAIFDAADTPALMACCKKIGYCRIGCAVVTPSFGLNCKYIIHAAGAGFYGGGKNEKLIFADCYLRALQKAWVYRCKSVAVPLMFSGQFNLPRTEALEIAIRLIRAFEKNHAGMEIFLVLYKKSIYDLAVRIAGENKA